MSSFENEANGSTCSGKGGNTVSSGNFTYRMPYEGKYGTIEDVSSEFGAKAKRRRLRVTRLFLIMLLLPYVFAFFGGEVFTLIVSPGFHLHVPDRSAFDLFGFLMLTILPYFTFLFLTVSERLRHSSIKQWALGLHYLFGVYIAACVVLSVEVNNFQTFILHLFCVTSIALQSLYLFLLVALKLEYTTKLLHLFNTGYVKYYNVTNKIYDGSMVTAKGISPGGKHELILYHDWELIIYDVMSVMRMGKEDASYSFRLVLAATMDSSIVARLKKFMDYLDNGGVEKHPLINAVTLTDSKGCSRLGHFLDFSNLANTKAPIPVNVNEYAVQKIIEELSSLPESRH